MKVRNCPDCGQPAEDGSAFCTFCGAKLSEPPADPGPPASVCPSCGAEIEEGCLFCWSCGARVQAEEPPSPPPEPPAAPRCPSCGAEIEEGSAFCVHCGALLRPESPPEPALPVPAVLQPEAVPPSGPAGPAAPPVPAKKKSILPILLPVLLVLLLLLGAGGFAGYRYLSYRRALEGAEKAAGAEDLDRAEDLYQEALEQHARSKDAALGLAGVYLHQGRVRDAEDLLSGLEIPEDHALYPLFRTLTGAAALRPEIRGVETENFPLVTVTLDCGGDLPLTRDAVSLTEEGEDRELTDFLAEDGLLALTYETEDTEESDEKREVSVELNVEGFAFRQDGEYRTPHFEPAQVRLVSTDVSEYPTVKAFFRVEDPATGDALEGLEEKSFLIRERLEGGEYLSREVHAVQPLAGNQGLSIGLLADKSSSIEYQDLGKIQQVMTEFVGSLHYEVGDQAEILAFDSIVQQMCTYTGDASLLANGIQNMSPDGMTALYDAIHDGVNHAALQGGARCVIAFTDGIDNRSRYTPSEIAGYAETMQVPVYIIGVGRDVEAATLRSVAEGSGGRYWFIDDLYDLEEIFEEIYAEQKKLYMVEYVSDQSADAYSSRDLEVSVTGGGYRAKEQTSFQAVPTVDASAHTSRYELIREAVTWEEAAQRCQEMGGHLATITSQAEMDQLTAMADAADLRYIWLGGYTSYDSYGGVFGHWVTGEDFSYQAWCVNEPSRVDSSDGVEEWYIMLWNIPSLGGWSWNDQRNDPAAVVPSMTKYMGYICEFEN